MLAGLHGRGRPLSSQLRADLEQSIGADFGAVRVHTGRCAGEASRSLEALAFTHRNHIVFGADQYAPERSDGRWLLAHELAHVVQQGAAPARQSGLSPAPGVKVQRAPTKLGTKVVEPTGGKPPFTKVMATFDGAKFVLVGDGKTILDVDAQSGHPNQVDPADAKACGGLASDSYLNNPRYVGIRDKGPIPEGVYTFRHPDMVTFALTEDAQMAFAKPGQYADPSGLDLHGDWGAGRVALTPTKIVPAKSCGNTSARSGFYLHGGIATGSSGCIDVGNSGIDSVVKLLTGYLKPVPVTVKYTAALPTVSWWQRKAGEIMYPKKKDADIWDRLGDLF